MSDRMVKLQECLAIAIRHKNPLMEENIRAAIRDEEKNPSMLRTADNWDAES